MRIPRKQFKLTVSQMLTIGVSVIAVILIFSMAQKSVKCQQKQSERDTLASEVAQIEARVDTLKEQLNENRNPTEIESSLREDFGMVGRNEGTLLLKFEELPAEAQPSAPAKADPVEPQPPHWAEWANALVNP